MRTSKYSEEQIIGFLRQAEVGMPIKELGRKHGFSDASFYKWRATQTARTALQLPARRQIGDGEMRECAGNDAADHPIHRHTFATSVQSGIYF